MIIDAVSGNREHLKLIGPLEMILTCKVLDSSGDNGHFESELAGYQGLSL